MSERLNPRNINSKIAGIVEVKAGKEFGPEHLTKTDLARALNLPEADISQEEWSDISEFAVHAGAALIRAAIDKDVPEKAGREDIIRMRKRVEKNEDKLIPFHDLFHAAEIYRLTKGKSVVMPSPGVDTRERYLTPQAIQSEFYPLLFFAAPTMEAPIPVLLHSPETRKKLEEYVAGFNLPSKRLHEVLAEDPALTPEGRQTQYEAFIEELVTANADQSLRGLTPEEYATMRENFEQAAKTPPEHYANFAHRVFSEEWETNPRLFLDELLECIRTKPE